MNFLIGPLVQVNLLFLNCDSNNMHVYLGETCYTSQRHIIFTIISMVNLVFYIVLSVILSIYYNEIGSLGDVKLLSRVNCSYEFLTNISKISQFLFAYIFKNYYPTSTIVPIIFRVYMLFNALSHATYVYKNILFFNKVIHSTILYGWIITGWFALVILLKILLNLADTLLYIAAGATLMIAIVIYLDDIRTEHILTNFNLTEPNDLKTIELYIYNIYTLMKMKNIKDKILLQGILKSFQDVLNANEDLKSKFNKLKSNKFLNKKYNNNTLTIDIICMIYIIYDYNLSKLTAGFSKDILINFCYFLIKKLNKVNYACYLCSITKIDSHKILYFKYILLEEIKEHMSSKLFSSEGNKNKETMKTLQIGSVILYNIYCDIFKERIYEALLFK